MLSLERKVKEGKMMYGAKQKLQTRCMLWEKRKLREAGHAARSLHRYTFLSKQLSSQGRVAAGHGGIILLANKRELHSLKALHDSPKTSQQL